MGLDFSRVDPDTEHLNVDVRKWSWFFATDDGKYSGCTDDLSSLIRAHAHEHVVRKQRRHILFVTGCAV